MAGALLGLLQAFALCCALIFWFLRVYFFSLHGVLSYSSSIEEGLDVEIPRASGVCFRYHQKWRILRPGSAKNGRLGLQPAIEIPRLY